jgi:hypothetical protein
MNSSTSSRAAASPEPKQTRCGRVSWTKRMPTIFPRVLGNQFEVSLGVAERPCKLVADRGGSRDAVTERFECVAIQSPLFFLYPFHGRNVGKPHIMFVRLIRDGSNARGSILLLSRVGMAHSRDGLVAVSRRIRVLR